MRPLKKSSEIPVSLGAAIVALGVVYGDIGTSPMYVMKSIIAGNGGLNTLDDNLILGALSLVIWTVTLLTTIKYVMIALRADNHGEGGIFSLYSLIKKYKAWLIIPAMVGGAALLADGILTPAVTVTTAIEGLRSLPFVYCFLGDGQSRIVMITLAIIAVLFFVQRAGTKSIGKSFGPVMTVWFLFLAISGIVSMAGNWEILRAFNPLRGAAILFSPDNRAGVMILGSVFLATTGAEALYSDIGHVGRGNVYASWPFVKVCLILNYLGQGAWLMANKNNTALSALTDLNPFFQMLPDNIRIFGVLLSTLAAVIASQALITGTFTLVSEAIRLDLMPHMRITYPSETKGQLYIPLVNLIMWLACSGVILYFRSSARLESAYGLAITLTMLMTTLLLFMYLRCLKGLKILPFIFLIFFGGLEGIFFLSSLSKFESGGYVALLIATLLFAIMAVWHRGTDIERSQALKLHISDYIGMFRDVHMDKRLTTISDNLVYLVNETQGDTIDRDILYSVFDKKTKRARAYWFVSVSVSDEPYTREYAVESFGTDYLFRVKLHLGFKVDQRINVYLRQIVSDLIASQELPPQQRRYSIGDNSTVGDFRFCILRKMLVPESDIPPSDWAAVSLKYAIRRIAGSPVQWYGLENTSVIVEYVPLFIKLKGSNPLKRVDA
ncbi:KUP/HAK/KT family potassium transporter [Eubacterium sp. 1001713B170207_170306_E7]|uniref:KUP/HAK/KT family potassium transporter n=1 Tax=Eubacterium sp. 1001713B170207_170306_E7 TaxID=2787097 RepID=UPI00189A0413|nr:KUP/HAK/KT family potassium transporter [Eubacterium sp. 1001713B170207_170306_E7]